MTNEELDNAREIEAIRIYDLEQEDPKGHGVARIAARLAREGWTPPEPVDPDLEEAEDFYEAYIDNKYGSAEKAFYAAIKRGRELERAEAKPGINWVKHDGSVESPVNEDTWVWSKPFPITPDQACDLRWISVTHYAIITQPTEDAA